MGLVEVDRLRKEYDLALDWQPFELRPDAPETGWELPESIRARKDLPSNPLRARARELGIKLVERDRIPSSRRAHECTEFARAQGRLEPFHAAILEAYWSEGADIHDWAVLAAAAEQAGLEAGAMQSAVEAGELRSAVADRVSAAHELGIHAVPTFVIADRFAIQGAQAAETFRRAFARLGYTARRDQEER